MMMLIALLLSAAAHPCADDAQRLCRHPAGQALRSGTAQARRPSAAEMRWRRLANWS